MGGGYAGLWTAIRIKQREPSCDVVVLEQDICGGGASGRNGGFAISWWAKLGTLVQLCGADGALELARACEAAVDELGAFCDEHGIDAHYHRGGHLWTTTSQAQSGAWDGVMATCRELGVMPFEEWSVEETVRAQRHAIATSPASSSPPRAIVQPARLVRGLRRVALELGVRIHEGTRVTKLDRRSPAVLHTPRGVAHRRPRRRRDERLGRRAARAAHAARGHLERHRRDRADARAAGARSAGRGTSASATRG